MYGALYGSVTFYISIEKKNNLHLCFVICVIKCTRKCLLHVFGGWSETKLGDNEENIYTFWQITNLCVYILHFNLYLINFSIKIRECMNSVSDAT